MGGTQMRIGQWYYWKSGNKRYILPLKVLEGEKFQFIIGDEGEADESDEIKWYGKRITRTRVEVIIGKKHRVIFWDLRTDYIGNYGLIDKQLAPAGLAIPLKLPSAVEHTVIRNVI
jgi:hypothetical protein